MLPRKHPRSKLLRIAVSAIVQIAHYTTPQAASAAYWAVAKLHCLSFAREMDAKVLGIATALLCSSVPLRFSKRRTDCSGLSWASCETHRTHTRLKRQLTTKQMGPLQNLQSCCVYKFLASKRRPSNDSSMAVYVGKWWWLRLCANSFMRSHAHVNVALADVSNRGAAWLSRRAPCRGVHPPCA